MTNSIDCIEKADVILLLGSNTSTQYHAVYKKIEHAVLHGKHLTVVDPRRTPVSGLATHFLQINPGTDIALINGMMHVLIKENLMDRTFIENRTEGFEQLKELLKGYAPETVEEITGVSRDLIISAARSYGKAEGDDCIYPLFRIFFQRKQPRLPMSFSPHAVSLKKTGHLQTRNEKFSVSVRPSIP